MHTFKRRSQERINGTPEKQNPAPTKGKRSVQKKTFLPEKKHAELTPRSQFHHQLRQKKTRQYSILVHYIYITRTLHLHHITLHYNTLHYSTHAHTRAYTHARTHTRTRTHTCSEESLKRVLSCAEMLKASIVTSRELAHC